MQPGSYAAGHVCGRCLRPETTLDAVMGYLRAALERSYMCHPLMHPSCGRECQILPQCAACYRPHILCGAHLPKSDTHAPCVKSNLLPSLAGTASLGILGHHALLAASTQLPGCAARPSSAPYQVNRQLFMVVCIGSSPGSNAGCAGRSVRAQHIERLQDLPYWGSWAITHFTQLAATAVLCALVLIYPFPNSDASVYLAFLLLVSAALIAFAYAASTLFSKAKVAGNVAAMLYAITMIPG